MRRGTAFELGNTIRCIVLAPGDKAGDALDLVAGRARLTAGEVLGCEYTSSDLDAREGGV